MDAQFFETLTKGLISTVAYSLIGIIFFAMAFWIM